MGKYNVVLIEDSRTVAAAVCNAFSGTDYTVIAPDRFVEIPAVMKNYQPVAIVLDLSMPAINGERIGAILRRNFADVPIIIYSSETAERIDAAAAELHATALLSKSTPIGDLVELVTRIHRESRQGGARISKSS